MPGQTLCWKHKAKHLIIKMNICYAKPFMVTFSAKISLARPTFQNKEIKIQGFLHEFSRAEVAVKKKKKKVAGLFSESAEFGCKRWSLKICDIL